jgi:hypothetical protein
MLLGTNLKLDERIGDNSLIDEPQEIAGTSGN